MSGSGALRLDAALARGGFHLDVSLEVNEGETAALVGPSGAGKSTCLAILTGLLRPDRGRASFGAETWCDTERAIHTPPRERRVGFVGQDFALFPHLDVRGNVAYGPRARGVSRTRARAEADAWLERLGLASHSGLHVASLSAGQRQRVALARALASGARVLLLDEPFASLDVATRAAVRAELRGFLEDVRLPALFVTHDAADALSLAGRIFVLEAGRITQKGAREELLSRPRTPFVAALFGLNHFRAELGGGGGLREARAAGIAFHVLAHGLEGTVWLAFAPSSVTLSAERPHGSAQNTFRGTIREVLPLADRVRVTIDCGAPLAADVVREAATALVVAPGRELWASVKATAIEVYP
jgi:molybdate transport system ATP-binding protein